MAQLSDDIEDVFDNFYLGFTELEFEAAEKLRTRDQLLHNKMTYHTTHFSQHAKQI